MQLTRDQSWNTLTFKEKSWRIDDFNCWTLKGTTVLKHCIKNTKKSKTFHCVLFLKYTLAQNWTQHEKLAGYMPPKQREMREPFYDDNLKLFKCTLPGCGVTLKRKSNVKRHE